MRGLDPQRLRPLVEATHALLMDFDGPICRIFAGTRAGTIADDLRGQVAARGVHLPDDVLTSSDPLYVLRFVGNTRPGLVPCVEDSLTAAELRAVATAQPTPYADDLLDACHATRRAVAVVSNNSGPAVTAYLRAHSLTDLVRHVEGRPAGDPTLMKPNPHPVRAAIAHIAATAARSSLLGDSPTDIIAGRAAGTRTIGFANKPGKASRLTNADVVIEDLAELAHALRTWPAADGDCGSNGVSGPTRT